MGCASSKQALRDKPIAPLARSYSLPIHHPAQGKGDNHHVVALTSTTLGTLKLDNPSLPSLEDQNPSNSSSFSSSSSSSSSSAIITNTNTKEEDDEKITPNKKKKKKKKNNNNDNDNNRTKEEEEEEDRDKNKERSNLSSAAAAAEVLLLQAKAWSNKIEGKISQIPKTPLLQTPPNEPETIDAWELMDGLEDSSPLRSFSFHAFSDTHIPQIDTKPNKPESPRPIWLQFNAEDDHPVIADFDPEILSHFRKALDELSPHNTCRALSPEPDKPGSNNHNRLSRIGTVQERIRAFQERIDKRTLSSAVAGLSSKCPPPPPRGEERVVIYFTSLRGVRKTYEECCDVRLIFRGYGVRMDERDVSMHQGFRDELYEILGGAEKQSFGGLPRVFVKGRYVGGAEDVRQLHESGELGKLVRGCEKLEGGGAGVACEGCGDVRFVPCDRCFGSCKIFDEDDGMFLRCPECNENGIILCPGCCI